MVVKINVSISKEILDELDAAVREEQTSRSAMLSKAVLKYLEEKKAEKAINRRRQAALEIQRIRESVEPWDATSEVLKWREKH